jgi:DNA modification methylase
VRRKNTLNDLSNRDWLQETKSFWHADGDGPSAWTQEKRLKLARWARETFGDDEAETLLSQLIPSSVYSVAPPRDELKLQHPATYSERDIERLIRLFTKSGQTVLDPFVGTGSTLLACSALDRHGIGIELISKWADVCRQRLAAADAADGTQQVIKGDAAAELAALPEASVDFVVTSPPYWSILSKDAGMKAKAERVDRGLATKYSEEEADLGNIAEYDEFLDGLGHVFAGCQRVMRPGAYLACVVCDFRHGPKFYLYHADVARIIEKAGLDLKGVTVLLQDSKNLYPFAIPYAFVSNIHHQYILVHQKPKA